jgi:AraC family transcriptional regulator, regulatory protein of adaptative response / methylated-DNA-[protein]-cysteine methyltransferase
MNTQHSESPDTSLRYALGHCTLGALLVAGTDAGICAIELGDSTRDALESLTRRFPDREYEQDQERLGDWLAAVAGTIDGARPWLDAPLSFDGTAFQRRVWERLCAIPVGTTVTYAALARELGDPDALRAVAGACAANPLAVIIPCHRVLRTDGGLGGYRWGIERKRALLLREGALGELMFQG